MANVLLASAVWIGLALLASIISIRVAVSVALVEIMVGAVAGNVIAGGESRFYPPANFFPSLQEFRRQFVDFDRHNFLVLPTSRWIGAGTDGRTLGAELVRDPTVRPPQPIRRGW